MAVKMAPEKFVYCSGVGAITIYTEAGQFGQIVLVTVATVHYLQPINLLHMQQPHHGLLTVLVVTCAPSGRYESYCVGLQETFTQQLIACRRDSYLIEKNLYISYVHNLAPKDSTRLC